MKLINMACCMFLTMVLSSPCLAQDIIAGFPFVKGVTSIKVSWLVPVETDIEKYKIRFFKMSDTNKTDNVVTTFNMIPDPDNPGRITTAPLAINLSLGDGFFHVTAIDTAQNESVPSNSVFYTVVNPPDLPPSAPTVIQVIKIND